MAALPHGAMTGRFRMTEQGETIAQKYANLANATYNLELLVSPVPRSPPPATATAPAADPCEAFMAAPRRASQAAYRQLLQADGFHRLLPPGHAIDALENSRIGSRPARRTGKTRPSIADLRAIPWVFSWTQAPLLPAGLVRRRHPPSEALSATTPPASPPSRTRCHVRPS